MWNLIWKKVLYFFIELCLCLSLLFLVTFFSLFLCTFFRARSQIPVYGLTGHSLRGQPVSGAGRRILRAKSWNKVYSMHRYPFMNNNGCQIYFILLPNLLVWKEIVKNSKVCNTRHALPFWRIVFIRLLYGGAG